MVLIGPGKNHFFYQNSCPIRNLQVLPLLDSPSQFSAWPGCPLIIEILLLIIKILLLPEVLKWNGGISCDSNQQTFRSIYVSFDHIDISCFYLASDFPVTEHAM
jgi:hypothetical protein